VTGKITKASCDAPGRKAFRKYNTSDIVLSRLLRDNSVASIVLCIVIMCETLRSSRMRIPFPTFCICKEQGTCTGPYPHSVRQKKSRRERCTALDWPTTTSAVRSRVKAPRKPATTMRQTLKPPRRTTDRRYRALPYARKFCSTLCPSPRLKGFNYRSTTAGSKINGTYLGVISRR